MFFYIKLLRVATIIMLVILAGNRVLLLVFSLRVATTIILICFATVVRYLCVSTPPIVRASLIERPTWGL